MKVAIEIMEEMKTGELDKYNAIRLIEDYIDGRMTAQLCGHRNEAGQLAKLKAIQLEEKLKPVVRILKNVDSMSYFPLILDGERFELADKAKLIDKLIKDIK